MRWIAFVLTSGVLALGCGSDDSDSGSDDTVGDTSASSSDTTAPSGSGPSSSSASSSGATSAGPTSASETGPGDTSATSDSSDDDSGTTGPPVEFMPCDSNNPGMVCPDGLTCFPSECCFGLGFCVPDGQANCGGIAGLECEGENVCVSDACIADAFGACVSTTFAEAACQEQTECWTFCGIGG